MSKVFAPKGRRGLPDQLINFGRHLVYSEGTRTEPYYVQNIKECIAQKYKVNANDIEIINANKKGKSFNTVTLANYAFKDVSERLKSGEIIDHVWIFYDKDSFPKANYDNAFNKINKLNVTINSEGIPCDNKGIAWHSLPSNECFELFLLLYFHYETASMSRSLYEGKINEAVRKKDPSFSYSKNLINIHSKLISAGGSTTNALKFGKKLSRDNRINNPSSKAYEFLEYFAKYFS